MNRGARVDRAERILEYRPYNLMQVMLPEEVSAIGIFSGNRAVPCFFYKKVKKGKNLFKEILENVRNQKPLIHNITNYVTVNDCANMLLAAGASPIMADALEEVEEITSICQGLNINIGTLNAKTIPAMLAAGKKANTLNHPTVLDPVGAGASAFRTNTALNLMDSVHFSVIRGNMSEIKALCREENHTKGVDVHTDDLILKENLEGAVSYLKSLSAKMGSIIAVSGPIDIVANEDTAFCIYNGTSKMAEVSGTGCQLSALIAAFISANKDNPLFAAAGAVCSMGLCGQTALKRMQEMDGNASYRNFIIDAMSNLSGEDLEKGALYEVR